MQSEKELRRLMNEKRRKDNEILQKIERIEKSRGFLQEIIDDFMTALSRAEKENDLDSIRDRHHTIPQSVARNINKKIKRGEFSEQQLQMIAGIDFEMTKEVPEECHRNFNEIFRGDAILTQALKRLEKEVLSPNYRPSGSGGKKKFLKFMFFVAYFNGRVIDVEWISSEVAKRDYIVPVELMRGFGIDYDDIMKYLSDNFFYPDYEQHWELWELLEGYRTKKIKAFTSCGTQVTFYTS